MIHGVSTGTSNGNIATPAAATLPKYRRYSSRSNSLSSSSVVTVTRPGSLSSSNAGAKNIMAPLGPQSPGGTPLIVLRVGRDPTPRDPKRRQQGANAELGEYGTTGERLEGLNSSSHSSNSSQASIDDVRRSRKSSTAALQAGSNQQFSPPRHIKPALDQQSPRSSPHHRGTSSQSASQRDLYSPEPSPLRPRRKVSRPEFTNPIAVLPSLHTTPALTDPNDTESPSTTQTIATPPTQSSSHQDYFGDESTSSRGTTKNKRSVVIRTHTAPMSVSDQTRAAAVGLAAEPVRRSTVTEKRNHRGSGPSAARESSEQRRSRTREAKEKDRKAMLSKALQKANTAVLLDNALNYEGALAAYRDACALLRQVTDRSTGVDDKRRLDAIRVTYTNRVAELRQLVVKRPAFVDVKDLPALPLSDANMRVGPAESAMSPGNRDSAAIETATATKIMNLPTLSYSATSRDSFFSRTMEAVEGSSRQVEHSVHGEPTQTVDVTPKPSVATEDVDRGKRKEQGEGKEAEAQDEGKTRAGTLYVPPANDSSYTPAPLSPRRPPSPLLKPEAEKAWHQDLEQSHESQQQTAEPGAEDVESASTWLDTIDESDSSCTSSVHSVSSPNDMRRKPVRSVSDETDPDFDAAFDAAVEAVYDQGLEPDFEARRRRETAYKHTAQGSLPAPSPGVKEILSPTNGTHPAGTMNVGVDDEEEERLLDEITSDYAQSFDFDLSSKSALPRKSDSSGYSRSTWQSSQASTDRTAPSSLSAVAEDGSGSPLLTKPLDTPSSVATVRPDQPLPILPPTAALPRPPGGGGSRLSGVRNRRLSGNAKQLKIETSTKPKPEARARAYTYHHSPIAPIEDDGRRVASDKDSRLNAVREQTASDKHVQYPRSHDMQSAPSEAERPVTATAIVNEFRRSIGESPKESRFHHRPSLFQRNKSSVSLRENAAQQLSSPEDSQLPDVTPLSATLTSFMSKRGQDSLTSRAKVPSLEPTSSFGLHQGGPYLFDTSLSSSSTTEAPSSPTSTAQPTRLEACPESSLLRPFWLMRVMATTLTHPKGGYLTTSLFVPREVWHTRNVKLKSIEDKIAGCDLLTAALGRLAGVDTYDADAVMDALQGFEETMERVQTSLAKKLGSDVGVHGLAGLFKDASPTGLASAPGGADAVGGAVSAATDKPAKGRDGKSGSYLHSWRKLRSKSSGLPLSSSSSLAQARSEHGKDSPLLMPSVPMTSYFSVGGRGHKRIVRDLTFEGPNKEYMGSLARLFEGAQVLGKIPSPPPPGYV